MPNDNELERLHEALAAALQDQLKKDPTASAMEVARKFLQDNGISDTRRYAGSPLGDLAAEQARLANLPYQDPDAAEAL